MCVPSVLWRCWLGDRKGIWPVKNWVVGCWHGYLSGARCRLAYSPADATATHCLLTASVKSSLVLPFWYHLTWVVPVKGPLSGCVCVCVCVQASIEPRSVALDMTLPTSIDSINGSQRVCCWVPVTAGWRLQLLINICYRCHHSAANLLAIVVNQWDRQTQMDRWTDGWIDGHQTQTQICILGRQHQKCT